jgi:hypothetical protein
MRTRPIDLTVLEARPSLWVKAALSLSKAEPAAGDTVNLYVDLLVRRPTQQFGRSNIDLKSQPINHVTLKIPALEGYEEIQPLEKYVEKRRLPPGQLGYHINNYPGVILLEQEPAGEAVGPAIRAGTGDRQRRGSGRRRRSHPRYNSQHAAERHDGRILVEG